MKSFNSLLLVLLIATLFSCQKTITPVDPPAGFYAYHTDLLQSGEQFNKYKDLVVVLGQGQRLEFSRETAYRPRWVTPQGVSIMDELFPEKDPDPNFDYTYVRLVEANQENIIVHWRYIPGIKKLDAINSALDPTDIYGFQAAVHETFTVYPDRTVIREVKKAEGVRFEDWNNPALSTRQEIKLGDSGIEHGEVQWGESGPFYPRPAVEGNKIINTTGSPEPMLAWTFDDGMELHEDRVREDVTASECAIQGSRTLFRKGVSGTALAFDGYYTGVSLDTDKALSSDPPSLTAEAWVALDAYPYNNAAVVHRSTGFGEEGFYLGIDPFGHVLFRVNGQEVKSDTRIKYTEWAHIAGVFDGGKLAVVVNGRVEKELVSDLTAISIPDTELMIGRNNEKERCTDYVREFDQNIEYVYSIQGLIDEVRIFGTALSPEQLASNYESFKPDDPLSDLALGVLPGEPALDSTFGAAYRSLAFGELWDGLWRIPADDEIVVNFDHLPTSVIFWKGTNYAANWVTDNNRWFADQSSEIWGPHGCSEHMADKQGRMCYARIIENSPARVVVHWRYPCVDVGYVCGEKTDWTDEYHTIYPDGTGVRKVYWNEGGEGPGFQDIQLLTSPGESALDVVNLQALSMANREGEYRDLTWSPPNNVPENPLEDADIELINTKSKYKVFLAFQGACFTPWGEVEQSKYTEDPFAGPWNHWPMHVVPSDGRFAVDNDRVTHFALAANDCAPEFESMVLYGFTDQKIAGIIPHARSWQSPPEVINVTGAVSRGYNKVHKSFDFEKTGDKLEFTIAANADNPVVNPCFLIEKWDNGSIASVMVNGQTLEEGSSMRQGIVRSVDGTRSLLIWMDMTSETELMIDITGAL